MIAEAINDRAQAIPYPHTDDRDERVRLRQEYDAAHAELNREFAAELAEEYLGDISESRRQQVADRVFRMAWEDGHSSGYYEIENRYMELADFALAVYSLATS